MQWSKFRSADSTDACLLVSTNGTCTVNRSIRYVFSAHLTLFVPYPVCP